MSRIPRILPLVGVAVGGVLAIKALAQVDALPKALAGARAFAEDAAPKTGRKTPAAAAAESPAKTAPAVAPSAAAAAPAPIKVCAQSSAELAKNAGLSPAELQILQSLGIRRTQIDQREADVDTQAKLLDAAGAKLDAKLKGLTGLKADLQALLGETEQKESAEIDRLVTVYSKMKPKDAAPVMIQLEDKVRIPVAAKMKETTLAAILSQMPPAEAKKLTESLAHRYDKAEALVAAANAPPPPDPTPAPAPATAPTPAKAAAPTKTAAAKPKAKRGRKPPSASASAAATKALAQAAAKTPAVQPAAAPKPAAPAPAPTASAAPAAPTKPAA